MIVSLPFLVFWLPLTIASFALVCRVRPALAPAFLVLTSAAVCLAAGPLSLLFVAMSVVGNFLVMRFLQRMEPAALREPLDRLDVPAVGLVGHHQAGVDGLAVEDDGAGAALALAAAFLGARQAAVLAQHVEQPLHRRHFGRAPPAVHRETDLHLRLRANQAAAKANLLVAS